MTDPDRFALSRPLWTHQQNAVDFALRRQGTLLAMEMGTGKSMVSVALANAWNAKRVLIVSPLSVVGVWPREFDEHSARSWMVLAMRARNTVAEKREQALSFLRLAEARDLPAAIVLNHEAVWREPFRSFALSQPWDLLVVDECHRAKEPGGKLSRFLGDLAPRVTRRLGLTGTPMPHSPLDVYAQMRFVDRTIFGTSYARFKAKYALFGGYENRQIVNFQNTDDLMERFRRVSFQARKAEVLSLPEEVDVTIPCELAPTARRIYGNLEDAFWSDLENGEITASNALVKLLRLQQVTSGVVRLDDGREQEVSRAKADALADYLGDVELPVVVFGRFRSDLRFVQEIAESRGLVYGEISGDRKDLTAESRMLPETQILAVQIQAGGVGIDLTRASTAVYFSTGFNLGEYLQSRSRLHRPGQKSNVTFAHLLCTNTIDMRVFRALRRREEVIDTLLRLGRGEEREAA